MEKGEEDVQAIQETCRSVVCVNLKSQPSLTSVRMDPTMWTVLWDNRWLSLWLHTCVSSDHISWLLFFLSHHAYLFTLILRFCTQLLFLVSKWHLQTSWADRGDWADKHVTSSYGQASVHPITAQCLTTIIIIYPRTRLGCCTDDHDRVATKPHSLPLPLSLSPVIWLSTYVNMYRHV